MELTVQGFQASAVKSGIRGKDRLDLGLIWCETSATAAGVFTTSLVKAAPVLLDQRRLQNGRARAILVNSGIANACTGEAGFAAAEETAGMAAKALGVPEDEVLVASTGVIGMALDSNCFAKGIPEAVATLRPDGFSDFSRAIMTTDTVPKQAVREVVINGVTVKMLGIAKGAGMIKPNMATMLAFVVTDVVATPDFLQQALVQAADCSFNRITVDGDTSTNDSVLLLASGMAGNVALIPDEEGAALFQSALDELLKDLALQIVRDGEGATKFITIRVSGARSETEARQAAGTVADSSLVKTAFFGEDANWGRIIAALGRSGAWFDPNRVDIGFDGIMMVKNGLGQGGAVEAQATAVLKQKEFSVNIDLKAGSSSAEYYTCDFSLDYVKINADYRS
ncbi:MAG: bifunctional glutamate N-acetyltransferase/amino-acid acetyltransferase ArgJ [Proteobacteria bacterium]|nr:bifunctional glutamate N-acetyltransferase/amino-acid acetyltransferase ArgJ [Pseudomonadota bacterium]MBU1688708.1 bifunctional glutamate N-acetyltransferase/amino-acid acetyltransferase ArgJ [Pseudomonadota bacterium]